MSGEDWPLRLIKYWDDEEEDVVYSAKIREQPIELRKILGYYSWIFNACDGVDREVAPDTHGYIVVVADKKARKKSRGTQAKKIDLAQVKGVFETCGIGSIYGGLMKRGECSWTFHATNLLEEEQVGKDFDFHGSEFFIDVLDVMDDNGKPFLMFTHLLRYQGMDFTYIGKKQKSKTVREGLTEGERHRLGIFVEDEEIERAALEKASASVESKPDNDTEPKNGDANEEVKEKDSNTDEVDGNPRKRKADGMPNEEESPCKK